jgi:hypothetical protein
MPTPRLLSAVCFRLFFCAFIALTAIFCATPAAAQARPLSNLKPWVGKSPYFLWKTSEPLHRRLVALLGPEYPIFAANLDPATDLAEENGVLHLGGNAPHHGGSEEAILIVDVPNDTIEVLLLHKDTIVHAFAENNRIVALPTEAKERMKHWPAAGVVQALNGLKRAASASPDNGAGGSAPMRAHFAPAPKICQIGTECEEANSFAATITDFRTSNTDREKVVTATIRLTNKLDRPLTLGLVQGSGLALDDQGNRYTINNANNVRGIGLIVSNTFDPKFRLQPGESADARVELLWPVAHNVIFGTSWDLGLTLREIEPVAAGQYRMGIEHELHFSNLVNRLAGRPSTPQEFTAASAPAATKADEAAVPAVDACGGAPRCYSAGLFTATVTSMTASQMGNFKDHLLRMDIRFRNVSNQPLILAYAARSSSAIDNLGNYYYWGHAGGRDQSTQGIGVSESAKANPSFVLQPGESRSAVFNVIRYRPGNAQLGRSFTYSLTIQQLQVLPSQQIRTVRDFSLNYPDIVPAGFSPATMNDGIRKIGDLLKKR